jgi:transcription initiation factor TFIIE subunit alpha
VAVRKKNLKSSKSKSVKRKSPSKARPKAKKPQLKAPVKAARLKKVPKTDQKAELKRSVEEEQKFLQNVSRILSDSNVRQNLIGIGGENALAIVRNFYGNHSDEELAKKLKIKISDVRATLNKLHNEGLVNYIREKDSETGWYSYSWSLNHDRMEKWAHNQSSRMSAFSADGVDYYFCPSCGTSSITNFESAAVADFRCDRCNRLLEFIDEKKMNELYEKDKP